jgi:hypothetical protein
LKKKKRVPASGKEIALMFARAMFTGPIWVIHHGEASGGPVGGPTGRVFGSVTPPGFDGTDVFLHFQINEIMSLLKYVAAERDGDGRRSIAELVEQGNNSHRPFELSRDFDSCTVHCSCVDGGSWRGA